MVDRDRRDPARPQDRVPRAPLPLHLDGRPLGHARPPHGAAGEHRAQRGGGEQLCARQRPRGQAPRARPSCSRARRSSPGTRDRDRRRRPRSAAAARARSASTPTTSSRAATRCSTPPTDGLWVEDVGSTNGTFVNGARVTTARLAPAGRRSSGSARRDLPGRGMRTGRAARSPTPGGGGGRNEDTFVCEPPLFAVADGMGGAQAGEIASRLAAAALEERQRGGSGEAARRGARAGGERPRSIERALDRSGRGGHGDDRHRRCSSTSDAGTIAIGHVGDSRAYRLRDGALEQLTARPLARRRARPQRAGSPTEEAADHPHRSVITRALGTEPSVEVDTCTLEAAPGRPLPDLLGRADRHRARRARSPALAASGRADPEPLARGARRRGERRRRRGQHHRRPLRDRRGRADPEPEAPPAPGGAAEGPSAQGPSVSREAPAADARQRARSGPGRPLARAPRDPRSWLRRAPSVVWWSIRR